MNSDFDTKERQDTEGVAAKDNLRRFWEKRQVSNDNLALTLQKFETFGEFIQHDTYEHLFFLPLHLQFQKHFLIQFNDDKKTK
jgi:hypothetical protein